MRAFLAFAALCLTGTVFAMPVLGAGTNAYANAMCFPPAPGDTDTRWNLHTSYDVEAFFGALDILAVAVIHGSGTNSLSGGQQDTWGAHPLGGDIRMIDSDGLSGGSTALRVPQGTVGTAHADATVTALTLLVPAHSQDDRTARCI